MRKCLAGMLKHPPGAQPSDSGMLVRASVNSGSATFRSSQKRHASVGMVSENPFDADNDSKGNTTAGLQTNLGLMIPPPFNW